MSQAQFTGIAGVHFTVARLSYLGLHAVPTTRNAQGPDVLVSTADGARSVTLQVKTTAWAMRTRGRGQAKVPHHYEWDIGWSSARINLQRLFFALVDMKEFAEMPDVYIVPSRVICKYFEGGDPETWTRARYHPEITELEPYRNQWSLVHSALQS